MWMWSKENMKQHKLHNSVHNTQDNRLEGFQARQIFKNVETIYVKSENMNFLKLWLH